MKQLLICNAKIVNEGHIVEGDVLIEGGRIAAVGNGFASRAANVIDAEGRYLLPGMIDSQVSFCEPGMTVVADIASESCAAIAGGVTSYLDLPDAVQGTSSPDQISEKQKLAQGRSRANYGFYFGAIRDNIDLIPSLSLKQACAVSVFLGGDGADPRLLDDPEVVEQVFARSPLLVTAHCEDMPTILENEESYRSIYADNIPLEFHPIIRSDEACALSTEFVISLAKRHETRLHLMQVSSAREMDLLSDDADEQQITAAVGAAFLHFSDADYEAKGNLLKSYPSIKSEEDRASLIQGLMESRLDMVNSGHNPRDLQQKQSRSYFDTPAGMPLVQHGLLTMLENYHDGIFSLEFIAEKTSHSVANRFDILERGFIREGYWADLVLADVEQGQVVTESNSLSRCGWTPFDGYRFRSVIAATIVNGELVWADGKLKDTAPVGMALEYDRSA